MSLPRRNLEALRSAHFDVVIIGGGIVGATLAWDGALRGLRVALVDRADFGGATTAGNFKIIHGGLRYLQHLDLPRVLESVREQHCLRRIASHLVHPLPFLIPCYGRGQRGRGMLHAGLTLYDILSWHRNSELPESRQLPRHRMLSADECRELAPGLPTEGLRGGAIHCDCQVSNSDRLTLSFVLGAMEHGAVAANYVEVIDFVTAPASDGSRRISTAHVRDRESGEELAISGTVFLNTTGPWIYELESLIPCRSHRAVPVFSKGVQVGLPQVTSGIAVAVQSAHADRTATVSRGGRSYFLVPWNGVTLIGTADVLHEGDPDDFRITSAEVTHLLAEVRAAYRSPVISPENVLFAFGGLRPVDPIVSRAGGEGTVEAARRERTVFHARGELRVENLVSVEGIKYTTARGLAERVLDQIEHEFHLRSSPCVTRERPVPGGDLRCPEEYVRDLVKQGAARVLPEVTLRRLVRNYGTGSERILGLAETVPGWCEPLDPATGVLIAEVVLALRGEMCCHLDDVLFRRTPLGAFGMPSRATIERVAQLAGEELGWSESRLQEELASAGSCTNRLLEGCRRVACDGTRLAG